MVSAYYTDLDSDQVLAVYSLLKLLRQLRVTGTLKCRTVSAIQQGDLLARYNPKLATNIYAVEKISYDPSKQAQDVEDEFNRLFGKRGYGLRGIG